MVLSLEDLSERVGSRAAKHVASRLVRKKILERVGRGRYLIRPLRTHGRPSTPSAPAIAFALLQHEPFYLGGLWALSHHRLTSQQYASVLDVFVRTRRPSRKVANARLQFHRVPVARLAHGTIEADVEGVHVRVSTPERTLLDLLDLPSLAGGALAAIRHVESSLPRVSVATLVNDAARGSQISTCQRLGVLLERFGVPPRKLRPIAARIRETKSLLSLHAGRPRTGRVNKRWLVVENDS
ncbi:MAG: hypothetical protein JST92_19115 [Deltaproteobacteria bacterium]|nr:hypothetical protein [Deltaproteobacteria bacterium]